MNDTIIIGIDHGYGNIKTANCCFKTGVELFEKEPTFKHNLLAYNNKFYTISGEHKEFIGNKIQDEDFYILTLAAIAREMNILKITTAKVHLATGLPLTWVTEQKDEFRSYLLQNEYVEFGYKGKDYQVEFTDCDVFPQGFSAVFSQLQEFSGVNMLVDIGNGTMNIMNINNYQAVPNKCFTEKFGVYQCILAIRENMLKNHSVTLDESMIEPILRKGTANLEEKYLCTIQDTAKEYVDGIFRRLREHEYNSEFMHLIVVGGGACLVKNFAQFDKKKVTLIEDICATAKGYELIAKRRLSKTGSVV